MGLYVSAFESSAPPAGAEPTHDPWVTDQMRLLGHVDLPNGAAVHALHVPGWPLPQTCLVLTTPSGGYIRCDSDALPSLGVEP